MNRRKCDTCRNFKRTEERISHIPWDCGSTAYRSVMRCKYGLKNRDDNCYLWAPKRRHEKAMEKVDPDLQEAREYLDNLFPGIR